MTAENDNRRDGFDDARVILRRGLDDAAFPAATIQVGRRAAPLWTGAFGRLTYEAEAPPARPDTMFDLASLTKVMVTSPLAMRAVANGRLSLDTPVSALVPDWTGADRSAVVIRHLLDHSSGLPAYEPFWQRATGREAIERALCGLPLQQPPGQSAVYSDPGFILLGLILERALGASLDVLFADIGRACGPTLRFLPPTELAPRIAPTEHDPWRGRLLRGEVHDDNAAALGGVAGHAGLFGSVEDVGAFARLVLETFERPTVLGAPALMREFASRSSTPGSSRALGWDTMLPTSSCGTRLSPTAIGHTGFTGTSLWIDNERDLYVALLTNRVHPTRENTRLPQLRPRLHDAIVEGVSAAGA